jgi:pimeloyl-ACP methyl ester carboxylesterase
MCVVGETLRPCGPNLVNAPDMGPTIVLAVEGPRSSNAILFMHGWPDDASIWDAQVTRFRQTHRCVRYTLPWYGPVSEADKEAAERGHSRWGYDFHVIADALALAVRAADITLPVTVVAHDWGAVHALYFCSRHKALARRLVLLDVGPGVAFPQTPRVRQIPAMLTMGMLYQYEMIAAWAISTVSRPAGVESVWLARCSGTVCCTASVVQVSGLPAVQHRGREMRTSVVPPQTTKPSRTQRTLT